MSANETSSAEGGQELTLEEQLFLGLPLGRLLIERGITPGPDFGVLEYDALALAFAHSAGRLELPLAALDAVRRIAHGKEYPLNRAMRREIEARARQLYQQSASLARAKQFRAPGKGGLQ